MKEEPEKKKRRKWGIRAAALLVTVGLFTWGFLMQTVSYDVTSDKLTADVRIVFISDLHNCFFGGTDQSGIMDEVNEAKPDIVIFGGDVIDGWGGTKHALTLMKKVLDKGYPCFYTPGNHEEMRDDNEEFYQKVKDLGIPLLLGEYEEISVKGQKIRIYGILDSLSSGKRETQLEECYDTLDGDYYNILIAHQPEQYKEYMNYSADTPDEQIAPEDSFDLILSGHAHGGQWRLPVILEQGLYAPDQGLFPKYTTGMYTYGGTTHIISRGLAKPLRMIFIPRIFNRPELSVIDIHAGGK